MDRQTLPADIILITILLVIILGMAVLYILSQRKNRSLSRQLAAAIEASDRQAGFFSNMTHELKTPLSVILGAVQLIELKGKDIPQDEIVQKKLKTIKYNCYTILRLINNLLDLSRSEAGYLILKPVNCDLDMLLEEIVHSVQPYAEKKELALYCKRSDEGIIIALDIEKIERIMLNLLSNAIKFTKPGGSIVVSSNKSGDRVYISVKDTGIGIPPDKQNEIFNRYRQSGYNRSAESQGSGIGLSLVKTFVELHSGNIKIISEKDKGSEFIIDLPVNTLDTLTDPCPCDFGQIADDAVMAEFSDTHTITT